MKRKYAQLVMIWLLLSCQNQPNEGIDLVGNGTIQVIDEVPAALGDTVLLQESFVDSITIGRKGFNKVEIFSYLATDSVYVDIKFYSRKREEWLLKQTIHFLKDEITGCETNITHFNNDRFKDMTIQSGIAARGANEVRRLFVYDRIGDSLIEMKNSEHYPNMLYNEELNCIDAFIVTGGSETVFLRISGDSLIEFASVEIQDALIVTETNKYGKERVLHQDTSYQQDYIRFKTYNPLKAYEDY